MTAAYPLAWPGGRPRTPPHRRRPSAFRTAGMEVTFADARARLGVELDRLGARLPVLSSNLELRLDGRPRERQSAPVDPGVAVYFQLSGRPMVLSCDRWETVAANVAAVAAHIEAMRGMARWGVGTVEQMFAGFEALPSPEPGDWRSVLGLGQGATLTDAEARWREMMRTAHPDIGGSHAEATRLNAAIAAAREELGHGM